MIDETIVHRGLVLFPYRPVIKRRIDRGACVGIAKAAEPRERRPIAALEELPEHDRAHLLEGLRRVRVEIRREMFALAVLDRIAAQLDHRKIARARELLRRPAPGRTLDSVSRAREVVHPVGLPRLAAVFRKSLFPARRWRVDARPRVANDDRPSLEGVGPFENAHVAGERSDHRRPLHKLHTTAAIVGPVDRPLFRVRIEEPERHADEPRPEVGVELVLIAQARQERPRYGGRLDVDPFVRTLEPFTQAAAVHVPSTHEEIEVVDARGFGVVLRGPDEIGGAIVHGRYSVRIGGG